NKCESMRRKGLLLESGLLLLGSTVITMMLFVLWLLNFKIHIYQRIIEEFHHNRVQEIPLAIISSDYQKEAFVEKINKAYYGFYSEDEIDEFKKVVKDITIAQVGEAYTWEISIEKYSFSKTGCDVIVWPEYNLICYKCSDECPVEIEYCVDPSLPYELTLADCLGSLTINITFFNETFPFPLTFNGSSKFVTEMRFNAYA
ncbi:MAG: hypothetical protein QXS37_06475, partial [Candidatus Aenigmatarchaeota archaeon]